MGNVICTSYKGDPGMKFEASLPSQQIEVAAIDEDDSSVFGSYNRHLDGVSFNQNWPPASIVLFPGIARYINQTRTNLVSTI